MPTCVKIKLWRWISFRTSQTCSLARTPSRVQEFGWALGRLWQTSAGQRCRWKRSDDEFVLQLGLANQSLGSRYVLFIRRAEGRRLSSPAQSRSDLTHWQIRVVNVQMCLRRLGLEAAPTSPRRLLGARHGDAGGRLGGHFARRVSCRDRRAGGWLWTGRGSRLMKCSLSHARLRACAGSDSIAPLWVAWWHGRYGRARDGGSRWAAVERGTVAVFLMREEGGGGRREGGCR